MVLSFPRMTRLIMHASSTSNPTPLFCENQGVLKLVEIPKFPVKKKHIGADRHFIWECKTGKFNYCVSIHKTSELLYLSREKFVEFHGMVGVKVNMLVHRLAQVHMFAFLPFQRRIFPVPKLFGWLFYDVLIFLWRNICNTFKK